MAKPPKPSKKPSHKPPARSSARLPHADGRLGTGAAVAVVAASAILYYASRCLETHVASRQSSRLASRAADHSLGGWPPLVSRIRFSDGHSSELLTLSDQPMLQLVRGLLSAEEVAELNALFSSNLHASKDVSKPGERNATRMWVPPVGATAVLDRRILELCEDARLVDAGEPPFVREQVETGYFASYDKPVGTPIFSLHNDNHARSMAPNPRVLSLVLHLNEPARNALTAFPVARRLGAAPGADPTDELARHLRDERPPPRGAVAGSRPEPWWRFITRQFDHDAFLRSRSGAFDAAALAASRIYARAEQLCASDAWDGLRPRQGDAAFFRSGSAAAGPEPRALHASCGNTGPKVVLSKFVRAYPLTDEQLKTL